MTAGADYSSIDANNMMFSAASDALLFREQTVALQLPA